MQPDRIAGAGGVDFVAAAIGIVAIDRGALRVLAGVDVGRGTNTDVHLFAFGVEKNGARPVAVREILVCYDLFTFAGSHRLRIVLIPLDGSGLADVEVVLPNCEAVWTIQTLDQFLAFLALKHPDASLAVAGGIGNDQFLG